MPTLVVIRHAQAENPAGLVDFARPLTPRGHRDAHAAGLWISSTVGRPGLVLCSPARRAAETAEGVIAPYAPELPTIVYEEQLYEASLGDLLHVVRGIDDEDVVALVGHNPSVSALVDDLTVGLSSELDTCGVAVVRIPSVWADTPSRACELAETATPRG